MNKRLSDILDIDYPIIMAPMFLVSSEQMILAALESGITAAFPAANYRSIDELDKALGSLKSQTDKPFGVNLIVNQSNTELEAQLEMCLTHRVGFVITSLGNPEKVIKACHTKQIPVFCDVTDMKFAEKVVSLGADALIAVNNQAGGHPGKLSGELLCQELLSRFDIPVIYAGGISTGEKLDEAMKLGVSGVSIGSLFLASQEAPISDEYKQAVIQYTASDIVRTDKLSGAPLHVINTDYVKSIGTKSTPFTQFLYRHKKIRRVLKGLAMKRGMKMLERAAFSATYKNVWVAGPSIEHIHKIEPVKIQVERLLQDSEMLSKRD
ncbi:MAG: nitronate monooxygenase [Bacteroidales bacterium]|jgi:nitronate monooxygenase|nr:nitronate monooxygenase [Bacteroidales bacterium]